MAVAEALAHGLPVVATMTGAIPDLVGDDAGLLVPVGRRPALTAALARVLGDSHLRARLAEGARRRRDQLPTWEDAARDVDGARSDLSPGHSWLTPSRTGWVCASRPISPHAPRR